MKRLILFFGIICLFLSTSSNRVEKKSFVISKVVIDPGHGGKDPGALGKKSKEKDLALAISLKVGNYIKENFSNIEVIYTRETDTDLELFERAKIANESHADLFISIHCNSAKSSKAHGTETWVMGTHKYQQNLEVAKKENASILYEDNYQENYDGYDPNSPETNIIFELFQSAYMEQSIEFASLIQKQFKERAGLVDRGVKQAGFIVLYKTAMPAVLVETSFINNPKEEEYLRSEKGQSYIASAIYRAFKEYKIKVEGGSSSVSTNNSAKIGETENKKPKTETIAIEKKPEKENPMTISNENSNTSAGQKTNKTVSVNNKVGITKKDKSSVIFRVQFTTSSKNKSVNSDEFIKLKGVQKYYHSGLYKFTVGDLSSFDEAKSLQTEMRNKGYNGSFVVAFFKGERISIQKAVGMLENL